MAIAVGVFDDETMCQPDLLPSSLPELPHPPWTKAHLERDPKSDALEITATNTPLPGVSEGWHHNSVDVLSLDPIKDYRSNVYEVRYRGRPAVVKICPWEWYMPNMENETNAHELFDEHRRLRDPDEAKVAPEFLGHVTENGRIMGVLLEKKEGVFASIEDLAICEAAVRQVHKMGLVHGDVNRYNFLVDRDAGRASLVDFEHVEVYDEAKAQAELASLPSELREDIGRGGVRIVEE